MYPAERQFEITRRVHEQGRVTIGEMCAVLDVTSETVRRDLAALERQGVLRRVRGGAVLVHRAPFELTLAQRRLTYAAEKRRIAGRVVELMPEDGAVFLDTGSLGFAIAAALVRQLPAERRLTVVTNNLPAVPVLAADPRLTVFALPGRVRPITEGAVDEWTRARLEGLRAELAVVAANGVSVEAGATTTVPEEAAVKRAMLLGARRRVVAVTSARMGRSSFVRYATLDEVDAVVTDTGVEDELAATIAAEGPEVLRA
ncbi:hypothetical protein BIV57_16245 [Mangrovactinospora gilvigrisea]|uniref:Lactose phosphotransferase system repressor n=1 Tax=Mangrovactinospora gilvigrisea TaxID=1428644 RepID=A0A1J7C9U6_9ACTN|nr:DeoR/GlpR family DNA-binding transcription regulator [Mangrovactinospora gilvigrisea]OIV36418.1 hypothetical protein BIV57_16245 [Mangrovactinospora gilvigrisea]